MTETIKWPDLYDLLPEMECDSFALDKFEGCNSFRCYIPSGRYVRLVRKISGKRATSVIMSNTPMEQRTCVSVVQRAYGDVLIGGFGLGMIVLAMQDKPEVKSITVLENNKEIINEIADILPLNDKVKVFYADVFDWKPGRGKKYDTIWLDIWNNINSDIYKEEMLPLKNKYRRYLSKSPNHWIKCWAELEARYDRCLF